ncbi:MAG: glycerol-3-phosphate 1-O-acyltransferase PlsY [Hydrogenophaga sp.]|mgnify:CR=1 FL=1|uniref:glycerol-3-phosphate 1-O-acyltransferase PlsY n=1 Tax=Hydrogenophaga sp. TaxID=1904254 RepID=UPI000EEE6825|nr:glycerol-3-phosphate 1-O-acyltransferase PlsY [Hydrogenophaga sp.]MDD3784172.1 glycerol-3-phosphate 1-O-acyltransferase PlsY [Hydrogenophaga sp.]MDX9969016.1 glycerol-3-phosphate 1-O-acyltransferase PlsY [Hydrogenophaga sp.]HAJ11496.1 glycerol-3-phosphate acyltransferase [Comamonadaceae bacterium]
MDSIHSIIAVVLAYLAGSLSFAVVVSRAMGLSDPRTYGSKNPGATNVLRSGSKAAAIVTLLLDAFKGWLPVFVVKTWGPSWGLGDGAVALVGLAAFVGHLWPVFFRFQGGKGVATAAGVILAFEPWLGLAALLTWVIVAFFSRYSSLASIVTAVFAPAYYLFGQGVAWSAPRPLVLSLAAMGLLLVWRHAENINRLIAGKESKIGAKKKAP